MCVCLELKIWLPWKRDVTALELYGFNWNFSVNAREGSTTLRRVCAHMWLVKKFRHVCSCDITLVSTSQEKTRQKHVNSPSTIWHAACYNKVNNFPLVFNYQLSYNHHHHHHYHYYYHYYYYYYYYSYYYYYYYHYYYYYYYNMFVCL